MAFFLILLIPLLACLAFELVQKKGGLGWLAEAGVLTGVSAIVVISAYFIAVHSKMSDKEIWNGVVASKGYYHASCCHPYCCMTCQSCSTDSKGNTTCSSYCCMTCYYHSYDDEWDATSSNNENVFHDGCNSPGGNPPQRWTDIKVGEPTAVEHSYQNYIKGNPDSLVRRQGAVAQFGKELPDYPQVYDYYRANRFISVGVSVPGLPQLNYKLSEINGRLGAKKKVDIVVVVVNEADERYLEALREHWIGGKINDIVVVVGTPEYPKIAWAGVISWSPSEQVKVDLRDAILALPEFDGNKVLDITEQQVSEKFGHRRISEFEYLKASVHPSKFATILTLILVLIVSVAGQAYFEAQDPFDNRKRSNRNYF